MPRCIYLSECCVDHLSYLAVVRKMDTLLQILTTVFHMSSAIDEQNEPIEKVCIGIKI